MSEQINVESIMKEIKKEIEVKGYTNDLLSFDDVIVDVGSMNVNKFDKVYFFVEPIVMAQDGFNASIVRLMNQMNCYIEEKDKEIAELKKEIEELKGGK